MSGSGATTYFDATNRAHLALLPTGEQAATDLALIATQAEEDVIGFYTTSLDRCSWRWVGNAFTSLGDGRGVFLKGYALDPADATTAFQDVMARTIARVIVWRLQQETHDTATASEAATGSTSRTYREYADSPFPRHWDRDLRSLDTRTPAWGL